MADDPESTQLHVFPPTRWSVVELAGREGAAALEEVCRAYWFPLYAFSRRSGHPPHDAQDLTQAFFCQLLEKGWLGSADREKGRLRTFLIAAFKHFMAKEWRRETAGRRGGHVLHVPIDAGMAEERLAAAPAGADPDAGFDRQWAMALLEGALDQLHHEFGEAGKAREFAALKPCLMLAHGGIDYGEVAAELGVAEGAARVAVHRLRKRFRQVYRDAVARTVDPVGAEDVDAEMRILASALSS